MNFLIKSLNNYDFSNILKKIIYILIVILLSGNQKLGYCGENKFSGCNSCSIKRLVNANQSGIMMFENSGDETPDTAVDYNVLEKINPASAPKVLTGFSEAELSEMANVLRSDFNNLTAETVIASYKNHSGEVAIKYNELEKIIMQSINVYDSQIVKLMPKNEKLDHLEGIIKLNLLVNEGELNFDKYKSLLINFDDYLFEKVYGHYIDEKAEQVKTDNTAAIDYALLAKESIKKDIDFRLQTQTVMLLKESYDMTLYTGEITLKLADCNYGSILLKDVFDYLKKNNDAWKKIIRMNDSAFVEFFTDEFIFKKAVTGYLQSEKLFDGYVKKYDLINKYNEYYAYKMAELVLEDFYGEIKITTAECEIYYKNNINKFTSVEGVIIDYFIFDSNKFDYFEKLRNISFQSKEELYRKLLGDDINFDLYSDMRYYKGQLSQELENLIWGLNENAFSKILKVKEDKNVIFFVSKKLKSEEVSFKECYPILYRMVTANKKSESLKKYYNKLYEKYHVKVLF